jgi:3D (Asp-Asp-Asp) domain-containing protein
MALCLPLLLIPVTRCRCSVRISAIPIGKRSVRITWRTIAINPATLTYGALLFIPEAAGQELPDGTTHDGYFFVADTGSPAKISGNHMDFFTGYSESPDFSLLSSKKHPRMFKAFIVKDPALVKVFTDAHR